MYQKGNTMQHGFTLVELMVVIAILAILAAVVLPIISGKAHGAEGAFTAQTSTASDIKGVADLMKQDPDLSVIVMNYHNTWSDMDAIDASIDAANIIITKIIDSGVDNDRIIVGMANNGSAFTDRNLHIKEDGIYLLLIK
jgi:prepilin-type N-terminal cleavage/methylation domain-containing protein